MSNGLLTCWDYFQRYEHIRRDNGKRTILQTSERGTISIIKLTEVRVGSVSRAGRLVVCGEAVYSCMETASKELRE